MSKQKFKILGIIGARSGSKGVPDKNIKLFCGKPLISQIIETALKSRYINRVIVSTDSKKYARIAQEYGAEVPFIRPKELARDSSPEVQYVLNAIKWFDDEENYHPDIIVRLLPTVPLQKSEDIDCCIEKLLNEPETDSAVVIAEARQHPMKSLKLIDDEKGGKYLTTYITGNTRDVTPIARQSYQKAFVRANVIACRTNVIKETKSLTGYKIRPHIVNADRTIDIDTEMDFSIAELLFKYYKNSE